MRCRLCLFSVGLFALAFIAAGDRRAEGAGGQIVEPEDEHATHSTKVETMIHVEGGGEEIRTFDMANPEELKNSDRAAQKRRGRRAQEDQASEYLRHQLGSGSLDRGRFLAAAVHSCARWPGGRCCRACKSAKTASRVRWKKPNVPTRNRKSFGRRWPRRWLRRRKKSKPFLDEARRDAQSMADDLISKAKSEILADRQRLHREVDYRPRSGSRSDFHPYGRAGDAGGQQGTGSGRGD